MMLPACHHALRRPSAVLRRALPCLILAGLLLGSRPLPAQTKAAAGQRRVALLESFREVAAPGRALDSAHAEVARATLSAAESAVPMEISLTLQMRSFDELERRVAAGEIISREEMAARFLPDPAQWQAVAGWLSAQGLTVGEAGADRLEITATGTPAQLQAAFGTTFARVKFRGAEYTAAVAAPTLPADVRALVRNVHGLQPYLRPHKHVFQAEGTVPYLPQDITRAYDIASTGLTGAGQRIGVVIDTTPASSDLIAFWNNTGVPQNINNVSTISVRGRLGSPTGEETLDVSWSSAIASGAQIIVYACGDLNYVNACYSRIVSDLQANAQPGLNQVTMSFGAGEETDETPGDIAAVHQYFTSMAAYGVSLFASAGDDGSYANGGSTVQTVYPASDPLVTGVGATSLTLSESSTIVSETAWSRDPIRPRNQSSSGGGISQSFARPSWQASVGVGGSGRVVPDVAMVGDPATGCYLVFKGNDSYPNGGTSLGAPIWAGMCALINQARANQGMGPVSGLNSQLYPLLGTASFHDITSGNNGVYTAGPGYDAVTGLGTPDFAVLLRALTTPTVTAAAPHPAFFTGETALSGGFYYLQFPSGNAFGYYSYLSDSRYIFHNDLGYEYVFDAADGKSGVYFYDFASGTFFYTSPSFPFPYLYDFTLNAVLYYYPNASRPGYYTSNPRYFYDFATGGIITK